MDLAVHAPSRLGGVVSVCGHLLGDLPVPVASAPTTPNATPSTTTTTAATTTTTTTTTTNATPVLLLAGGSDAQTPLAEARPVPHPSLALALALTPALSLT